MRRLVARFFASLAAGLALLLHPALAGDAREQEADASVFLGATSTAPTPRSALFCAVPWLPSCPLLVSPAVGCCSPEWLQSNGARLEPALRIQANDGRRGLHIDGGCSDGTPLATIPASLAVSVAVIGCISRFCVAAAR